MLCSLLCIIWYKINHKDINSFIINFGSCSPGFLFEILSFLITISPKCPTVGEILYICLFPQTTHHPTSQNKIEGNKHHPPFPVLLHTHLFITSPLAPFLPDSENHSGLTPHLVFDPPLPNPSRTSPFPTNDFLVFPNLKSSPPTHLHSLRSLWASSLNTSCLPKAKQSKHPKVLALSLCLSLLLFSFARGQAPSEDGLHLPSARVFISQCPTPLWSPWQAHQWLPPKPTPEPWLSAAGDTRDQVPAGQSLLLWLPGPTLLPSPIWLILVSLSCWFLFLWSPW